MAAALVAVLASFALAAGPASAQQPNIVVIETDDQTVADLASMPRTRGLIGAQGTAFANSVVNLSLCCPSRATLLTGRYAHNHGVLSTGGPFGGVDRFDPNETLAVWLQRAGYSTALVGKYMNGYGREVPPTVPPGWTEWHGLSAPGLYRFYGFTMSNDGVVREYPDDGPHQNDALTDLAEDVIERRAGAADPPLFLWLTYVAPHVGRPLDQVDPVDLKATVPARRHRKLFDGVPMPRTPAFDEADVGDKPRNIRRREELSGKQIRTLVDTWRPRQESLLSVDEGVGRVMAALRASGEIDDTIVVFTSDNGWMTGEHRAPAGKILPYEPSIRVPLLMRGPGIARGETREELAWNGDLAPTLLEAAGTMAPGPLDGASLWPYLRDPALRADRAVFIQGPPQGKRNPRPRFEGVRTARYMYAEYPSGEVELYDLERDPDQLDNIAGTAAAAAVQGVLALRLDRLRGCAGATCR